MSTCRRILITYGTKAGSTADIAEFIAQQFREMDADVDVLPVEQVRDVKSYCAVILGTATRIGKPLPNVVNFAKKHAHDLAPLPLAYFVVGITMREDTPEHRAQAVHVLDALVNVKRPFSEGLFAGKVDYTKIEQLWRFFVSHDRSGELREGDWRNWDAIRDWVKQLAPTFMGIAALPNETV